MITNIGPTVLTYYSMYRVCHKIQMDLEEEKRKFKN
jgi:hypothetical protein